MGLGRLEKGTKFRTQYFNLTDEEAGFVVVYMDTEGG